MQDYGIDFNDKYHPIKAFRCCCGSENCRDESQKRLVLHIYFYQIELEDEGKTCQKIAITIVMYNHKNSYNND